LEGRGAGRSWYAYEATAGQELSLVSCRWEGAKLALSPPTTDEAWAELGSKMLVAALGRTAPHASCRNTTAELQRATKVITTCKPASRCTITCVLTRLSRELACCSHREGASFLFRDGWERQEQQNEERAPVHWGGGLISQSKIGLGRATRTDNSQRILRFVA
jgi:hypothetical protein